MGAPLEAAEPFTFWYRSTPGLGSLDGQWRVVHEHTSTPFHMDGSLPAATDVQPCTAQYSGSCHRGQSSGSVGLGLKWSFVTHWPGQAALS